MKFLDDSKIPHHPYPELREVLNIFVGEVAAELKENLVGIYLVGSVASGDFLKVTGGCQSLLDLFELWICCQNIRSAKTFCVAR